MKIKTIILVAIIMLSVTVSGKNSANSKDDPKYGLGLSLVTSGSGQGEGFSMTGSVLKGRKYLEVGLIFNDRDFRINGGDIRYRIILRSRTSIDNTNRFFTPYIQYNLMYQKSLSYAPDIVELNGEKYIVESEPGMVATIGHYLGYGSKIRIFENMLIDASAGLGLYNGSLDKINGPGTWGIHYTNYGYTYAVKIGLTYSICCKRK